MWIICFSYSGSNNHKSQINAFNISHNGVIHVQLLCSYMLQECIPVGRVPSAAVAVCWGRGCLPAKGRLPRGWLSRGVSARGVCVSKHALSQTPHPPVNRMTDRCKNITFPQLRLRAVINVQVFRVGHYPFLTNVFCLIFSKIRIFQWSLNLNVYGWFISSSF